MLCDSFFPKPWFSKEEGEDSAQGYVGYLRTTRASPPKLKRKLFSPKVQVFIGSFWWVTGSCTMHSNDIPQNHLCTTSRYATIFIFF